MPYLVLPSHHYASKWSQDHEIRDFDVVTDVGVRYANCADPTKKEELLLELVRYFHSYTFKYVGMILSGTLPMIGERVNEDAKQMLRMFLPAGVKPTGFVLAKTARTLYLAFKGQDTEEVYNVLVGCLIKALGKYDPNYVAKVKKAAGAVDSLISPRVKMVTAKQISEVAGFNCTRICRMLVRRGHLQRITKENQKTKYFQKDNWPPAPELLNGKPIGVPYFVSGYFRRYLQQYITEQMKSLEARSVTMQLEPLQQHRWHDQKISREPLLPSAEGNIVEPNGKRWMADTQLMNREHDLPDMNLGWVTDCNDPLFSGLERRERLFLYQHYAKEMTPSQICQSVGIPLNEYDQFHAEILEKCRDHAMAKAA
jgi:hypothetical protein